MDRWSWAMLALVVMVSGAAAENGTPALPKIAPREPANAATAIDLRPGFHAELVAAEPLVRSPVAIDFDEDGRLYVAEFPEYNQYANPAGSKERGRIQRLTDTDGDGRFDTATVYADNLDSPVAVACWDGGVFVGVVPDLWYFKDTDGDGRADVRRKVLTGFDRDRAGEAMLNSFRWGPDHRFHIATGLAGGSLRPADNPNAPPVLVRRQNIRFDPRTGAFEPTSGGGQHGLTLDDWGDTFVCDNSNPIEHLAYDARYLARNPFVVAPSPVVDVNAAGRYPNLHRISPPEPWREARTRLRKDKLVPGSDEGGQPFGFFTGATGVTVYRGDAFPPEFRGNIFVGEVANNLVYRARPEPKGLGWSAVRAEIGREFLASRDVWFRPVQFANAPDGCLYVVDMYRELIEGAAFLPPQLLQHVNVAGGQNRGRIWRIIPDGAKRRPSPMLGAASTAELVSLLEHANGWHRDTAARLIYQRQDKTAAEPLHRLATTSASAVARMHARYALDGLEALTADDVVAALSDTEPRCREHALRLAEKHTSSPAVRRKLATIADDAAPRVRYQLAFTLGAFPVETAAEPLARLARKDGDNAMVRLAVLCSAHVGPGQLFADLLTDAAYRNSPGGKSLLVALVGQIGAAGRHDTVAAAIRAINGLPTTESVAAGELVRTLVTKFPPATRNNLGSLVTGQAGTAFRALISSAQRRAADETADPAARAAALRSVGLAPFTETKPLLVACLDVRQPPPVQIAALETLAGYDAADVPSLVLAAWPGMSPRTRATATETVLSRSAWVAVFLDAVERGTVRPTDLDPARVQLLRQSPDELIRSRVTKLFTGGVTSKRADVITRYLPSLELKGNAAHGKAMFKDNCSACHRLEGVGEAVGPDLAAIKNRGSEAVLANILDPNREVLPQYYTYVLTTDAGVTVTGVITTETANTVTLRKADGASETVQRVNVESLRSTGLSAMPDGLEQKLDRQAMADLLAYLASIK